MIHFTYFPKIEYGSEKTTNLLARGKVRDMIKEQSVLYYPYTIRDEDRADIISTKYYGSPDFTWILYYANNIKDPAYDWPLTADVFDKYIISKYGNIPITTQTIHHYEVDGVEIYIKQPLGGTTIQPNADYLNLKLPKLPEAISVYEYESRLNEAKRNILIIDKAYVSSIVNELQHLFD